MFRLVISLLKEIITIIKTETRGDALKVAKSVVGDLGDDAIEYKGKFGSQQGKVTGKMSADKTRGYRIDFDDTKGAHINWWNGKEKGAIPFKASENQVRQIIENELMK